MWQVYLYPNNNSIGLSAQSHKLYLVKYSSTSTMHLTVARLVGDIATGIWKKVFDQKHEWKHFEAVTS